MQKMTYRIGYDQKRERYIYITSDGFIGELHCGDTFEARWKGRWYPTRIEMRWYDDYDCNDWYLINLPECVRGNMLQGLEIRM